MKHLEDSDLDLHGVNAVMVRIVCDSCGGKGRVRGGEVEYGELVDCPICDRFGTTPEVITLLQLKRLIDRVHDPEGDRR